MMCFLHSNRSYLEERVQFEAYLLDPTMPCTSLVYETIIKNPYPKKVYLCSPALVFLMNRDVVVRDNERFKRDIRILSIVDNFILPYLEL